MERKTIQCKPRENRFKNTFEKGRYNEERAWGYFQSRGYSLVQRNFFCKAGELDLILLDPTKSILVFVEVRSSFSRSSYLRYSVGYKKLMRLVKSIHFFIYSNSQYRGMPFRLDLLWLEKDAIDHYKNITVPLRV